MTTSLIERLCAIIERAGVRTTFDPASNNTHPCYLCDAAPQPTHDLVGVAVWVVDLGCWRRGDKVRRPLCEPCARWMSEGEA